MLKKVNVLMSTYNGEKYLPELMDSLLKQDYPNFEIHIRDDGSTDGTVRILREYLKDPHVYLYEHDNVGYRKSFAWLLENCQDADYFAYCDQDDIWMPQKISEAVRQLDNLGDKPALYVGDFYWSDAECKPRYANAAWKKPHTLEKYITTGDMNTFGFTEVFNKKAADAIRGRECTEICVHDQVVYLYCLCCGSVVWGKKPLAYYRRFGGNASPQELHGGNRLTHLMWQLRTFLFQNGRDKVYGRFKEFLTEYESDIGTKHAAVFRRYIEPGHRIRKVCYRGRYRDKAIDEIAIRVMFLIGRM